MPIATENQVETERDQRLGEILGAYFEAAQHDSAPSLADLLREQPDFASELAEFFAEHDRIRVLTEPLRSRADSRPHQIEPRERVPSSDEFASDGLSPSSESSTWLPPHAQVTADSSRVRFVGDYEILGLIGQGGMGLVFKARQCSLGRSVALKMILAGRFATRDDLKRFQNEAETIAVLDHPNIVPIYEVGQHDGCNYFAMKYISGSSLAGLLASNHLPTRQSAGIMATVARAIHHAHQRGILHRDLKPSNILLDEAGTPHVTDFGLARRTSEESSITASNSVLGTPSYMAPEQAAGRTVEVTTATDVYGLGAILYALITGRPPFRGETALETIELVRSTAPTAPCTLNPRLDRDLETICLKCLQKEPKTRYGSAEALAEDLECFLDGQPIHARPVGFLERAWRWARLNKPKAAALGLAVASSLAIIAGGFLYEMKRREAAEARASVAQAQRDAAQAGQREGEFQTHLLRLQHIGSRQNKDGWRKEVEEVVGKALKIRADGLVRDFLVPTFAGLDVRPGWATGEFGGSSVAFDSGGGRLLVGGLEPGQGRDLRAKLIDLAANRIRFSSQTGAGPVAFDFDRRPLQLVATASGELLLWDVERQKEVVRIEASGLGKPSRLAISPDGRLIAAAYDGGENTAAGVVRVSNVATGRPLFEAPKVAQALAFSPDGRLLASGDIEGWVEVHRLADGSRVARFRDQDRKIYCLSFAPDPWRDAHGDHDWLLAEGGTVGPVVIWDLKRHTPRARCYGSPFFVSTLAFSPDASILASTGRQLVTLWDTATGQPILRAGCLDNATAVAFSPDGRSLAISGRKMFDSDKVRILEIENGRAIRLLRGLSTPIMVHVVLPRRRQLAAWGHDRRAGLWDLETGQLRYVRDGPEQFESYSLHTAVSRDETQLAVVGGKMAALWEIDSGRTLGRWPLPEGIMDSLAFPSADELILARLESRDGKRTPYDNRDPANPNVYRVRNLLAPPGKQVIREISGFEGKAAKAGLDSDGRKLTVLGSSNMDDNSPMKLAVIDVRTGKSLWSRSFDPHVDLHAGPSGMLNAWREPGQETMTLLDLSTGKDVGFWNPGPTISRRGPRGLSCIDLGALPPTPLGANGFSLRRGEGEVLFNFSFGTSWGNPVAQFTADGRQLIWGNWDGTVSVCDLEDVRKQLNRFGLGWPEASEAEPEEHQ